MAMLFISMPKNCLKCDLIKEWYGTERKTTFVRCHAGKCEMPMYPAYYLKCNLRPKYCPIVETKLSNK